MDRVDVDGLSIAYRRAGKGPLLVLLHGALSDSRDWRRQMDSFGADFTVIAWDAPGCGGSDDVPPTFGLDDYVDTLARFIDVLHLGRPHLLGLSLGGILAIALHGRHPDVARSLVLASAYAGWAGPCLRRKSSGGCKGCCGTWNGLSSRSLASLWRPCCLPTRRLRWSRNNWRWSMTRARRPPRRCWQ